jgi:hypothetical protein
VAIDRAGALLVNPVPPGLLSPEAVIPRAAPALSAGTLPDQTEESVSFSATAPGTMVVYHGYEIEEYNGGWWVHLHDNPMTIGYKTLKSAEDFVDWMEGHK